MKRFMTDLAADPLMAALLICFIVELSVVALNSFLACIGALAALGILAVAWFIWPYIMIVVLRLFSTKAWQAKMIDDLKNDSKWSPFQKQKILQLLHAVRWHENKES